MGGKMTKENVAQWLGNRGWDVEPSDIIKCKKVGHYLFVNQKKYRKEIDLFDLYDSYAECINTFETDDFKWNLDHLRKLITGELYGGI
jgi:hypothetical protein